MTTKNISTQDRLIAQLTENTGRSFLDSGGTPKYDEEGNYVGSSQGYGRAYERDKHRPFKDEPEGQYDVYNGEILVTISTFHFLIQRVDLNYSYMLDQYFQRFMKENDSYGMLAMNEYIDHLRETGHEVTGLYGEGTPQVVNTYNHDSRLDRVLQYLYFEMDGDSYVLLQTHNGADVRGGYSTPVLYKIDGMDGSEIFMDSDASLTAGERYWQTDDGYHWYENGSTAGTNLEDMPFNEEAQEEKNSEEDIIWLSEVDPDTVYVWDNNAYVGGHKLIISIY